MPAATPGPPPLEDLLTILTRVSHLEAEFSGLDQDTITLKYTFKREHLGPAGVYVFGYPSMIFAALKDLISSDDAIEKAFRATDPRNTIEDVIGYLEQKRAYIRVLNGLSDKMDAAFFESSLKYLRELDRRRREIDRRLKAADEVRRKAAEDDIKSKVEEEIRRREQERERAKTEAHARWEQEERVKRKWQQQKTSDSGFSNNAKGPPPGFDPWSGWEEILRKAKEQGFDFEKHFGGSFRNSYDNPFGKRPPPPPPPSKDKWYEILGCHPGANRDQIRKAAREAASGLHPDTSTDPDALRKFQAISEAKAEGLQGCR